MIIPADEGPPGCGIRTALADLQTGHPAYEQPTPLSVDFVVETSAWPLCLTLEIASLALASLGTPLTALSKLSQALSRVLIVELAAP